MPGYLKKITAAVLSETTQNDPKMETKTIFDRN